LPFFAVNVYCWLREFELGVCWPSMIPMLLRFVVVLILLIVGFLSKLAPCISLVISRLGTNVPLPVPLIDDFF